MGGITNRNEMVLHTMKDEIKELRARLAAAEQERDEADKCLIDSQCVVDSRAIVIDNLAAQLDLVTQERDAALARAGRLEEKMRDVALWIERVLGGTPDTVGYADPSGHPHYGVVFRAADWELRRHLDECTDAIAEPADTDTPATPGGRE